jgi:hypothetical protein
LAARRQAAPERHLDESPWIGSVRAIMPYGRSAVTDALQSVSFFLADYVKRIIWPWGIVPGLGGIMASTRRRKLKKLRMKKANHGKRPLAGK